MRLNDSAIAYELFSSQMYMDEATGFLFWKSRGQGRRMGVVLGTVGNKGYLYVRFNNSSYLVHRVVWLLHTGKWPVDQIDHINRIKNDNRPCNLREADHFVNAGNRDYSLTQWRKRA